MRVKPSSLRTSAARVERRSALDRHARLRGGRRHRDRVDDSRTGYRAGRTDGPVAGAASHYEGRRTRLRIQRRRDVDAKRRVLRPYRPDDHRGRLDFPRPGLPPSPAARPRSRRCLGRAVVAGLQDGAGPGRVAVARRRSCGHRVAGPMERSDADHATSVPVRTPSKRSAAITACRPPIRCFMPPCAGTEIVSLTGGVGWLARPGISSSTGPFDRDLPDTPTSSPVEPGARWCGSRGSFTGILRWPPILATSRAIPRAAACTAPRGADSEISRRGVHL